VLSSFGSTTRGVAGFTTLFTGFLTDFFVDFLPESFLAGAFFTGFFVDFFVDFLLTLAEPLVDLTGFLADFLVDLAGCFLAELFFDLVLLVALTDFLAAN
jgi:hypothetical protein